MMANAVAFLNDSREYVFPSIPGRLKSGALAPIARVLCSGWLNADEQENTVNRKQTMDFFIRWDERER